MDVSKWSLGKRGIKNAGLVLDPTTVHCVLDTLPKFRLRFELFKMVMYNQ